MSATKAKSRKVTAATIDTLLEENCTFKPAAGHADKVKEKLAELAG